MIQDRLNIYNEETLPILDFYLNDPTTTVIDFEAKQGKKDYPQLKDLLN